MFKNCRKEDLRIVALELELIQYTIEDRKRPEEDRKKEAENRLREKELELELARLNVRVNSDNERTGEGCNTLDALVKSVRILTVKVPNRPEGCAFFFASLERAFVSKNVPEKFKSEILLNLLGEKASNVLAYVKDDELNNYEQLKSIILREYEPSANQFLEQFKKATRHPNETYIQYTSRLITNWQYYLKFRKVSDFDNLKDLIVSDKIFSSLEKEVASHISVRTGNDWFRPLELAKEIDLYNTSRGKSLKPLPNVLTRNNPVKNASRVFLKRKTVNRDLFVLSAKRDIIRRYTIQKRMQMLLGAEVFYELMLPGQFKMEGSNVIFSKHCFRNCRFRIFFRREGKEHCGFIQAADNLEHSIKKFWEIENVKIDSVETNELDFCEYPFKNTHSRDDQGRYTVAMPLKEDPSCLGESRQTLIQRLNSLWKRLVEIRNICPSAPVVMIDCYMDDILTGSESIEEEYAFLESDETKALGIIWNPKLDCFLFRLEQQRPTSFTKRMVLSTIARIFDPLGLLGPIITWAKIFMERLRLLELGWSDELPFREEKERSRFIDSLEAVNNISIDRCIVIQRAESIELHAFSDASEKAYGSSIYLKSISALGEVKVCLVTSKSRVSPLKQISIPRLELCGAVLAAKMMKKVKEALNLHITAVHFWSDSTIEISWIHRESRELKTFVANRDDKGVLRVGGRLKKLPYPTAKSVQLYWLKILN
ncbi:integrase catalytic domain-containing protein [Trichonephila clavipes]|nr:integrase catalytic domain-containing protein [Trichonephila clavipes]